MENNTQPTEHKKSGSGMMITIVIIVLIAIIALASSGNSKKDQAIKDAAMAEQQTAQEQAVTDEAAQKEGGTSIIKNDDVVMVQGSYEEYAPEKLAMAEAGPVVLFFKASWCPSCKAVDKDINANLGAIPTGISILKIDYDNSKDLQKKYGVTYQHTFVQVDAQGNMIKKWSGSPTLSALVSQIKL